MAASFVNVDGALVQQKRCTLLINFTNYNGGAAICGGMNQYGFVASAAQADVVSRIAITVPEIACGIRLAQTLHISLFTEQIQDRTGKGRMAKGFIGHKGLFKSGAAHLIH